MNNCVKYKEELSNDVNPYFRLEELISNLKACINIFESKKEKTTSMMVTVSFILKKVLCGLYIPRR